MIKRLPALLAALCAAAMLQGCLEMAVVGAGAGVMSAVDRRTTGTQIEDEGIELRTANRVAERLGDRAHVNVTSFNRSVLLTGEVPDAAAKTEVERIARGVPNVRGVTNEVQVAGVSAYSARASDSTITGKVKARFLDSNKLNPVHVKVVTESSIVYLLGMVTEKEAADATELARTTSGVRKVVKVFEYCRTTDEACRPR
ncbi:MAG: BON domain-containing protein [Betaproteobacteria bacterium]|nr:MAG: BON domain-containing protein [Betaproteobacteria bacterium]